MLIYFIHHVFTSIQADSVIASVGGECDAAIQRLFPEELGEGPNGEGAPVYEGVDMERVEREGRPVAASANGSVQAIDGDGMISLASKNDLVIRPKQRPGDFVIAGFTLFGVSEEIERLAGQAGLLIMQEVMEAEVERLAGPKGKHEPARPRSRWGCQPGYAVLAGRKVELQRPRVRDDRKCEVPLTSYARFQSPPRRQGSIVRQLIHGISTRKYERAIEQFTDGYGISKSAVSRSWITATRESLKGLCERRIDRLPRMVVVMIDGVEYAGECIVIALGVDETGKKHALGLIQGATECAEVVQNLLDDLVERGLDPRAKRLFVLEGSKALRSAVKKTFGAAGPVQRCQLNKRRNIKAYLTPENQRAADQRLAAAYSTKGYAEAKKTLLGTVGLAGEDQPIGGIEPAGRT